MIEEKTGVTNFSHYHIRRQLIAQRKDASPIQRERINILIRQLEAYQDEPSPELARLIERQTRIVAG